MNFENLKTSLELNSEAEPTVELAFRLSHLLFKDIAEEAGVSDIVNCPAGKAAKFLKALIRQCYVTEMICSGNAGLIEGYRDEIEEYLVGIRTMRTECEELESQATDTEKIEETIRGLEGRLAAAKKRKTEYDGLQVAKAGLEAEIEELKKYDPTGIQEQIDSLTGERNELFKDKASLVDEKKNLESVIEETKKETVRLTEEISKLMRVSADNEKLLKQKCADVEKWSSDRDELADKLEKAEETLKNCVNRYAEKKAEYDKLANETIPAQEQLVKDLEKDTDEKAAELEMLAEKLKKLNETKEAQESEVENRTKREAELNEELRQLKDDIVALDENIGNLQDAVDALEAKNDAQRLEQLNLDLEEKRLELLKVGEDCAQMGAQIARVVADTKEQESNYAILSNQYEEKKRAKATLEERIDRIREEIKNITAVMGSDEEIHKKLEHTGNDLRFLNELRGKLCNSIVQTAKYLDAEVNLEDAPEHEMYPYYHKLQLMRNIEEIGIRLEALRKCLAETAAFLKKP